MTDWFRNSDWNDDISAAFETKLARARGQKAQYLSLQGFYLIANRPLVARALLERAVALDDEFETPRALANLAMAQLALGDVDAALDTYELGLHRQLVDPRNVAIQAADYAFLVGYFSRVERLAIALPIAEAMPEDSLFGPDPQIDASKALLFEIAGRPERARAYAARALPQVEHLPEVAALGIAISDLKIRLERLI